jgi:uncharacterized protein DUF1326
MTNKFFVAALMLAASVLTAKQPAPVISGDYLEVRSCDVYTGSCFANAEMNLAGKEGILVWAVRQGAWNGVSLDGLSVIAVVRADNTLGDLSYQPRSGPAVLVVDEYANAKQRDALVDFARTMSGKLIKEVAVVKSAKIEASLGTCTKGGCASVKAGTLVEVATRCLGGNDHICGNEENFYPPLTEVKDAYTALTELAAFRGKELNVAWESRGQRSAYLASFSK